VLQVVITLVLATSTTAEARIESCKASWYGPGFHGRTMANGQRFNQHNSAHLAHKSLPFGTKVLVTNLANGKSIQARVTDRGPFVKGRCVDLSLAGAKKLGFVTKGHALVEVRVVK